MSYPKVALFRIDCVEARFLVECIILLLTEKK
jgi:hypothetical protein